VDTAAQILMKDSISIISPLSKETTAFFPNVIQTIPSDVFMKDKLFEQLPDDQKFDELTADNLQYIKDNLDPEENTRIIFDDMGAYLKNNETKKQLKEFIMNRRHLHISIFFLVQTYLSIERDIRKLFSNCFIFRCSKKEMETIADELIETSKDYINDIVKTVYDKPYEYLFINTDTQRIFKGFDEILIDD
jgi:hypothetical protein